MIREVATRKSSMGYRGLLLIFIITILVLLASSLVGYIQNNFGIRHLEYIVYFMLIAFGVFVIRYFVTQYRYSLFDDQLIIERMLGKRIDIIVNIYIWDIVSFDEAKKHSKEEKKKMKTFKLYVQHTDKYSIIYKKNDETFEAVFNPSQEFISQLNTAIEQRTKKQQRVPDIIT